MTQRSSLRFLRAERVACSMLLAVGLAVAAPGTVHGDAREENDEKVEKHLAEGYERLGKRDAAGAAKHFRKATKREDEPSFRTHIALAKALNQAGSFDAAAEAAGQALELADSDAEAARAHYQLGIAAFRQGTAERDGYLEAEREFRRAVELKPRAMSEKYLLGVTLLKLERDDEGVALLEEVVQKWPTAEFIAQARSFLDDPRRAREPILPAFAAKAVDGSLVTPEVLHGKVLLFDFWGTWCKPCRDSVPYLRNLQGRLGDRPFTIVGFAAERSNKKVREFTQTYGMEWPQVLDSSRRYARQFQVTSYPTYLVVDHTGRIVYTHSGASKSVEAKITSAVKKAVREAEESLD